MSGVYRIIAAMCVYLLEYLRLIKKFSIISDNCDNSHDCKHGGYPNPNNCDECICPEGLAGECNRAVASSSSNCGGDLIPTSEWQNITLPEIVTSQQCNWRIKVNCSLVLYAAKVVQETVWYCK